MNIYVRERMCELLNRELCSDGRSKHSIEDVVAGRRYRRYSSCNRRSDVVFKKKPIHRRTSNSALSSLTNHVMVKNRTLIISSHPFRLQRTMSQKKRLEDNQLRNKNTLKLNSIGINIAGRKTRNLNMLSNPNGELPNGKKLDEIEKDVLQSLPKIYYNPKKPINVPLHRSSLKKHILPLFEKNDSPTRTSPSKRKKKEKAAKSKKVKVCIDLKKKKLFQSEKRDQEQVQSNKKRSSDLYSEYIRDRKEKHELKILSNEVQERLKLNNRLAQQHDQDSPNLDEFDDQLFQDIPTKRNFPIRKVSFIHNDGECEEGTPTSTNNTSVRSISSQQEKPLGERNEIDFIIDLQNNTNPSSSTSSLLRKNRSRMMEDQKRAELAYLKEQLSRSRNLNKKIASNSMIRRVNNDPTLQENGKKKKKKKKKRWSHGGKKRKKNWSQNYNKKNNSSKKKNSKNYGSVEIYRDMILNSGYRTSASSTNDESSTNNQYNIRSYHGLNNTTLYRTKTGSFHNQMLIKNMLGTVMMSNPLIPRHRLRKLCETYSSVQKRNVIRRNGLLQQYKCKETTTTKNESLGFSNQQQHARRNRKFAKKRRSIKVRRKGGTTHYQNEKAVGQPFIQKLETRKERCQRNQKKTKDSLLNFSSEKSRRFGGNKKRNNIATTMVNSNRGFSPWNNMT